MHVSSVDVDQELNHERFSAGVLASRRDLPDLDTETLERRSLQPWMRQSLAEMAGAEMAEIDAGFGCCCLTVS
jgi:hypothetical protein